MKYKLFVVSDIHGHFDKLITALSNAGFDETNEKHKLIVCGDLFDRGSENVKVFLYLYDLNKKEKAIIIKGNHDIFFKDIVEDNEYRVHFNYQYNQFDKTISEFSKIKIDKLTKYTNDEIKKRIDKYYPTLFSWLDSLPFYFETKNYLFTHAGIQLNVPLDKNNWSKAVWIESEKLENIDLTEYGINKILVMGHRPTIILGKENYNIHFSKDKQKIYIDGGAAYNGKMNVLIIDNEELL